MALCTVCGRTAPIRDKKLFLYQCKSCHHYFTLLPKDKQEEYASEYFDDSHRNWFANPNIGLFQKIHRNLLRFFPGKLRVLDVGCGQGDFLKYVASVNKTAELSGIDLISNKDKRIRFIRGDFLKQKFTKKYDAVVSLATIEHINEQHEFVEKINRVLGKDGIAVILTLNNDSLIYNAARIMGMLGFRTAQERLYSFHHVQHYSNISLRRIMELHGFKVLSHRNHNYPLKAVDVPKSNFIGRKLYLLAVAAMFALASPFGIQVHQTIICRKIR